MIWIFNNNNNTTIVWTKHLFAQNGVVNPSDHENDYEYDYDYEYANDMPRMVWST